MATASTNQKNQQDQQMTRRESKDVAAQPAGSLERMESARTVAPPVDILEGKDETWLVADLPGVTREDLEIELHNNELRLRARPTRMLVDESAFVWARAFRLPPGIDAEKVAADLKDGVLTLKLPKPSELRPKKIDVRVA
jgi:HSP20 family molecular chaperone IbpA